MSDKVTAIFGGPTGAPEPNDTCIEALEEWLEMARAGELVGVVMAGLCADRLARYRLAGMIGGYSLLGAVEIAKADLIATIQG